jgi:3-dehydroquinate synthase
VTVRAHTVVRVPLGERAYDVLVGPGVLAEAAGVVAAGGHRRVAVVTQDAVAGWAVPLVERLGPEVAEVVTIADGEPAKSLATVELLTRRFAAAGLLRGDAVLALGGGVVGDTAGFAAAVYHRGIAVYQAPTTLLAQVDAAIGGKTAVNLPEGKNLVGAFHQPRAVFADTATLATLPAREYRAGLGEVAKYAFLDGAPEPPGDLADRLLADGAALARRDPGVLTPVVARCAAMKAIVVGVDEHERTGVRAILNYGHTLAHAIETLADYALLHGEAVAVGMVFAAALARALERVDDAFVARQDAVLAALDLPRAAPAGLSAAALTEVMRRDKKAAGGLTFVLPGPDGVTRVDDPPAAALATAFAAVGVRA